MGVVCMAQDTTLGCKVIPVVSFHLTESERSHFHGLVRPAKGKGRKRDEKELHLQGNHSWIEYSDHSTHHWDPARPGGEAHHQSRNRNRRSGIRRLKIRPKRVPVQLSIRVDRIHAK